MVSRLLPLSSGRVALVGAAAILSAGLVGALTAADVSLGIGLLMGLCYAPLVFINLPAGLAVWVAVVFIEHLPAVSVGPNAAGILIIVAWVGTLGARREQMAALMAGHRKLMAAGVLGLVWLSLSAAWAQEPAMAGQDIWQWWLSGVLFLIVATTITRPQHVLWIVAAFVTGAAASVVAGLFGGGLSSSATALHTATALEGRLQGGGGDPNYLAASLIPGIVFAGVLLGRARDPVMQWIIAGTMGLLTVGLAATQSRGGLVAAVVTLVVALVVGRRKGPTLALVAVILVAAAGWFATSPGAWQRVTDFNGGGNGRDELWAIGWQIFKEKPVVGVGLNNFRSEAHRYVRRPGNLKFVNLIAERPRLVHNAYLQMLVETGVVGLILFMTAIVGCLRAAWMAARRFEAAGQQQMGDLARAVLIGAIGMLAASFFLSNATDKRLWILLALGPALLLMAGRQQVAAASPRPAD